MHRKHGIKRCFSKILFCICVMFIMMWSCTVASTASTRGLQNFGVEITTELDGFTYVVKWWQPEKPVENEYYITIPYSAQNQNVKINYVSRAAVYYDGEKIDNGMEVPALRGGKHIVACADQEYTLYVLYGSDIPTIHIETESGSMGEVYADKSHKEPGYAVIQKDNGILYEGELDYIKGRGNATWDYAKKPFNIKFQSKINLFEMGKAKKWTLLANYLDDTLLKNKLACDLADTVGIAFSSKSVLVDLYIDGEYCGNYTLIESVEIGDTRVDITDLEEANEQANPNINMDKLQLRGVRGIDSYLETGSYKWVDIPTSPGVINGGYLLEFELADRYDDEASGFISGYGQPIIIKSPEYASKEQVQYISSYYQEFEDAVLNEDGYNARGKHYSDYIDMESMAKMYVFQEYVKNLDAGLTSFYLYKDVNEKLVAGPVWDFDSALGRAKERNGVQLADPIGIWVADGYLQGELSDKKTIFSLLFKHEDFRGLTKKQWDNYFVPNIDEFISNIDRLYKENQLSLIADKLKWKCVGDYHQTDEWLSGRIDTLTEFANKRSEFMSEMIMSEVEMPEENVQERQFWISELIRELFWRIIRSDTSDSL